MGLSLLVNMGFRYLRPLRSRAKYRWLWVFPIVFALLFFALHGAVWFVQHAWADDIQVPGWLLRLQRTLTPWNQFLRDIRFCVGCLANILVILVILIRIFNMFTTISIFGLFLGSGALVCAITFSSGLGRTAKDSLYQFEGDLEVQPTDDQRPFLEYNEIAAKVRQLSNVRGVAPTLTSFAALIGNVKQASMVKIRAVSPETIQQVSLPQKAFVAGGWDRLVPIPEEDPKDREMSATRATATQRGIVVGSVLAKDAMISVGDDVELILPDQADGPQRFWVVGIFYSGNVDFDREQVFVHLPALQAVLGMDGDVSLLRVRVANHEQTQPVQRELQRVLGMGPDGKGYEVRTTAQKYKSFLDALAFEKTLMFFGLGLIVVVAAFSIVSNGLMQASEKKKEISILKSMGVAQTWVLALFTGMGLFIGSMGVSSGVLAGVLACKAMERWGIPFFSPTTFYVTNVSLPVQPAEVGMIVGSTVLVSLLAMVYPAWIISRQNVVEGLR